MARMKITIFKEKLGKLAFRQLEKLQSLGQQLFALIKSPAHQPHQDRLRTLLQWFTVPLTLWRIDLTGLGQHIAQLLRTGQRPDRRLLLLLDQLNDLPCQEEQDNVAAREFDVQTGAYDSLLRNPSKYDALEKALLKNEQLIQEWEQIKQLFDITPYRNTRGVIRRTQMQERNFHASEWSFDHQPDKEKWLFQAFFDLFCHRYNLYGMEYDKPLLQRLTVNRTAYGTIIFLPRYMYPDPRRDLNWTAIQSIHWHPELQWQGPKASDNQLEKNEQLRRVAAANAEALARGLSGDARWRYIEDRAGLKRGTDRSTIRRFIREAQKLPGI